VKPLDTRIAFGIINKFQYYNSIKVEDRYIFEVLIYRIKEIDFDTKYEIDRKEYHKKYMVNKIKDDDVKSLLEKQFWENYGGPWLYNQVIGAIRILIDGIQIIGELWLSGKSRYTRIMKNKRIYLCGTAFEMGVFKEMTNNDIYQEVRKRILDSIPKKRNLVIDVECFDNISKYIDWRKLFPEV